MIKNKANILVTGSKGQLGQEIAYLADDFPDFTFLFVDIEDLDISNPEAVDSYFATNIVDYCINCAAFTAVDRAEEMPEIARAVNENGVKCLAEACQKQNAKLIQISTDYVYHNGQNTPFKEGDEANPQGVYARTKLAGDNQAIANGGMVVRTSWVYSSFGNNFVKTMLRLGAEREKLGIIFDQIGTPTYARDLAKALLIIIQKTLSGQVEEARFNEVYHYSNEGVTSWYDFAKAIFDIKAIAVKVDAIETKDYPTPASRPPFSLLNKAKIKSTYGLEIPHWRESLRNCLTLLK